MIKEESKKRRGEGGERWEMAPKEAMGRKGREGKGSHQTVITR